MRFARGFILPRSPPGFPAPAIELCSGRRTTMGRLPRLLAAALLLGLLAESAIGHAQPAGRVYRLGILSPSRAPDPGIPTSANLVPARLRELGYVEGQNLVIVRRFADDHFDRLPALARELVAERVDVIHASTGAAVRAARDATAAIPIVMIALAGDPVRRGLVASLSRPGGNVTGIALTDETELTGKRLELLKEAVPHAQRVAVLSDGGSGNQEQAKHAAAAASVLGLKLAVVEGQSGAYDRAFATMTTDRADALLLLASTRFPRDRKPILALAAKHRLPMICDWPDGAAGGSLLAYGADVPTLSRRAAEYIDRIFRGAKPADLPVEQPMKFRLAVNLKTARALGLAIPQALLLRADEVIQ
jgi:putative ABC transport system substrate-binding protein